MMAGLTRSLGVLLIVAYKRFLSPLLHAVTGSVGACRFQPTCSEYALLACSTQGMVRGSWLTLSRCLRCNPLFAGGFDPVPPSRATAGEGHRPPPASSGHSHKACKHSSAAPFTIER